MLKIKFRNGFEGEPVDWTPYMVLQEAGPVKRMVESDNPGEAGLVVFDNVELSFRYEEGNPVYGAFYGNPGYGDLYLFELYAIKRNKDEIKLFEGIVDFTTIEWDLNEKKIRFTLTDKIMALSLLTDAEPQRGNINDASARLNCGEYLTDYIKRIIPGMGVWIEIQTYELINNGGTLERGNPIAHTETVLKKGETFFHPGEGIGLCLVTDCELMQSMGGWTTTFIKTHPVKWCRLMLPLSAGDTSITVSGNIFAEGDIIYLEKSSQTEFIKIINNGFGSDVSWIYGIERHYTGGVAYDWNEGDKTCLSDTNLTYITDINSPPVSTHITYYGNCYYGVEDINIYGADSFGRNSLAGFDAFKILSGIISRTLNPVTLVNRTGGISYPVSLNYYNTLCGVSPLGKHSFDALKLLADSMRCYMFIDRPGRFVIQSRGTLGAAGSGIERSFDTVHLAEASIPCRYFWDKLIDGVEARIISDGYIGGRVAKQIFPGIKPRNELCKELTALGDTEFTGNGLASFASAMADEYLGFYGKRHESYTIEMPLYDDLLEWELLDYISFGGRECFFTSIEIDITGRTFRGELVTLQGENYYKGQANIPLSINGYIETSGGAKGSYPEEESTAVIPQAGGIYSAAPPIAIDTDEISLLYGDNLILSPAGKLDTVQGIKPVSTPRFGGIGIGCDYDPAFRGKFEGNIKVTGAIFAEGDLNIGGSINEVNVTELNIADKTLSLNKGGSDSTAPGSGIKILGTGGVTAASIIYDDFNNWFFNKSINLQDGLSYKINGSEALGGSTLGSGIVNSSLTKVGIITQGTWNGTPLNAQYINYNSAHFLNSANQLSAKTIAASSGTGVTVAGTFVPGGSIVIDTPQDLRITASPSFNNITLNGGTLNSGGNLTIALAGNGVLPNAGYAYNLGSLSKKFLTLHAAELCVETLVAQNTKASIGGRVLIGETNELTADLTSSAQYIYVKYNNLAANDIVYLEGGGHVEFMKVLSLIASGAGWYEYQVQRNLDSTGADEWYAGDAVFNTGIAGDGFIDLYSLKGIKGVSQPGPTIAGNVRNSLTYNDWSEHWAIGNLNGLYGFTANRFGAGLGRYGNNSCYITIDSAGGFAVKYKDSGGVETKVIELDTAGNGFFRGNITSSATITGGIIQTALSGKRVKIEGSGNDIKFYNSAGEYISVEGYLAAGNEKRLHIGGTVIADGDLYMSGYGQFSGDFKSYSSIDAVNGFKIDGMTVIDRYYNASLGNVSGNIFNVCSFLFSGYDLITERPAASKILVSDSARKITASAVNSSELFTAALCELYDDSASSTILCDGVNYVKWSNATVGVCKGDEGSSSSDCILIREGYAGIYRVDFNVTFTADTAGEYYWAARSGVSVFYKTRSCLRAASTGIRYQISGGGLLQLAEGDLISLGCFGQNGTSVSVVYVNFRITKISN